MHRSDQQVCRRWHLPLRGLPGCHGAGSLKPLSMCCALSISHGVKSSGVSDTGTYGNTRTVGWRIIKTVQDASVGSTMENVGLGVVDRLYRAMMIDPGNPDLIASSHPVETDWNLQRPRNTVGRYNRPQLKRT